MANNIPPIGTKGVYALSSPWSADAGVLYTCSAIRKFIDLENLGVDVYTTYYQTSGLDRSVYEQDRRDGVVLITLTSDRFSPIYVPSSYIASFPDLSYRNYQHIVLSASIGPLPDYMDLTFAKQAMATALSDIIGIEPTVFESVAPMDGVVSPDTHEALEVSRQSAINNRETDYAKVIDLQSQVVALSQRNAILEQILRDNGLLPT